MSQEGPQRPRTLLFSESDANATAQKKPSGLSSRRKVSLQSFNLSNILGETLSQITPDDLEIEDEHRGLFIDFDGTMVNGNWHNAIGEESLEFSIKNLEDKFKILIEKFGLKNPAEMYNLIRYALSNRHHVAVLTANHYAQDLVPRVLQSLGLTEEEIARIYIKNGSEKNALIQKAKKHFNIRNYRSVLLLDDMPKNRQQAENIGCQTIAVPAENNPEPDYFDDAIAFVKKEEKKLGLG